MENVATTHCFALFAHFLHFHENNDLKVPERSKNGPKKVPILSQRPKFCLCSDFSRQVPNPKSYIGAPAKLTRCGQMKTFTAEISQGYWIGRGETKSEKSEGCTRDISAAGKLEGCLKATCSLNASRVKFNPLWKDLNADKNFSQWDEKLELCLKSLKKT